MAVFELGLQRSVWGAVATAWPLYRMEMAGTVYYLESAELKVRLDFG